MYFYFELVEVNLGQKYIFSIPEQAISLIFNEYYFVMPHCNTQKRQCNHNGQLTSVKPQTKTFMSEQGWTVYWNHIIEKLTSYPGLCPKWIKISWILILWIHMVFTYHTANWWHSCRISRHVNFEMETIMSEISLNNSLFVEFTWDKGLRHWVTEVYSCINGFFLIILLCKYYPTPEHWKVYINSPHFLLYIILEGFSWCFITWMGALFTV